MRANSKLVGGLLALFAVATGSKTARASNETNSPSSDLPMCAIAANWVRTHASELPTSLAEFSAFSVAYRRAIYATLSLRDQEDLWREQLTRALSGAMSLEKLQRNKLQEAIDILPSIFDAKRTVEQRRSIAINYFDSTEGVFTDDQRRDLFVRLGSAEAPWAFGRATNESAQAFRTVTVASIYSPNAASLGGCECAVDWAPWDCGSSVCIPREWVHCDLTEQGCGPFAQINCDGNCDGVTRAVSTKKSVTAIRRAS